MADNQDQDAPAPEEAAPVLEAEVVEGEVAIEEAAPPAESTTTSKAIVIGRKAIEEWKEPTTLDQLTDEDLLAFEAAIMLGDYGRLDARQRMAVMTARCRALGMNPLLSPYVWATVNKKLTLVRTKSAGSMQRKTHNIGIRIVQQKLLYEMGVYFVMVEAYDRATKEVLDVDIGVTPISNLKGEALSNSMMIAITKAKNRVTESCCAGGGGNDEHEISSLDREKLESRREPKRVDPNAKLDSRKRAKPVDTSAAIEASEVEAGVETDEVLVTEVGSTPKPQPTAEQLGALVDVQMIQDPNALLEEEGEPQKAVASTGPRVVQPGQVRTPGSFKQPPRAQANPQPTEKDRVVGAGAVVGQGSGQPQRKPGGAPAAQPPKPAPAVGHAKATVTVGGGGGGAQASGAPRPPMARPQGAPVPQAPKGPAQAPKVKR